MRVQHCITSIHGITCYESFRLLDSFKSYIVIRIFEYIIKETMIQVDKKLVMESIDGVSFT